MNKFFVSKVANIVKELPPQKNNPCDMLEMLLRNRTSELSLNAVHPDKVLEIISNLKNSKSVGLDYIDTYIIKLIKNEILAAVTHIINLSIQTSKFPTYWKTAKVIPLLKKGDSLIAKNYRPVAILPIFSKILERVIFMQIVEYMDINKLFHPNHHGFRKHHNTTTALLQMYDSWIEGVENSELVGVCMLDMSAAFDVVSHQILLDKMKLYGFKEGAIN